MVKIGILGGRLGETNPVTPYRKWMDNVLDKYIDSNILLIIKIIGFWNFMCCVKIFYYGDDETRINLVVVLTFIIILSFARPAQRYLMFIVPLWGILICNNIQIRRIFMVGYICLLISINTILTFNQVSTSKISNSRLRVSLRALFGISDLCDL